MTKGGGFYVVLTLLLGFAAVNTGNNLLFLTVSAMLGFMAVSGILGWMNIRWLFVKLTVPDEIYANLDSLVTIHVSNTKKYLPSFLLKVELCSRQLFIPLLDKNGISTGSIVTSFAKRGRINIPDAVISSPFPVNFFVRYTTAKINHSLVVFPTPVSSAALLSINGQGDGGGGFSQAKGYEGDLIKIGNYTGAEPLKLIHWRLSAKHEILKVKELSAISDSPVIIELEKLPGHNAEQRLSLAAFLVNMLVRENRPVGLKTAEVTITPSLSRGHRLHLLETLALYGQD